MDTRPKIVYKEDIESIAQMHRKRWGIETGYRVKKDFLAITTTECYIVRMLYLMVSVILYNFWLLCNLIYCREHGIELGTPKITTRIIKLYIGLYLNNVNKDSIEDPIETHNSVSYRFFIKNLIKCMPGYFSTRLYFLDNITKEQTL